MAVKIIKPPLIHAFICNNSKYIRYFDTQNAGLLRLGTRSNNTYRTLMKFDLSSLPFPSTIIRGTLNLFVARNEVADTAGSLGVFQVFSEWDPKNVSWNKQPLTSSTPVDSISATNQEKIFLTFNITELLQNWSTNRSANLGMMLQFQEEQHCNFLAIPGRNYPDSRFWPYLELNILDPDDRRMLRAIILEQSVNVATLDSVQCTSPFNILIYDYSYLVVNTGASPAVAYLQVSPNSTNWQTESTTKIISPGALVSFVPDTIAKYARLCYQSQLPMQGTSLTIYIQGRSYS